MADKWVAMTAFHWAVNLAFQMVVAREKHWVASLVLHLVEMKVVESVWKRAERTESRLVDWKDSLSAEKLAFHWADAMV